jgi:hypothetical protein
MEGGSSMKGGTSIATAKPGTNLDQQGNVANNPAKRVTKPKTPRNVLYLARARQVRASKAPNPIKNLRL